MVSTAPFGKKAKRVCFLFQETICMTLAVDTTFPPGHTLIDYPGAQSNESNTKCL